MTATADIDQDYDPPDPAPREWPVTAGAFAGVRQADWNTALERALRAIFGQ
jgi:hypothetical protein